MCFDDLSHSPWSWLSFSSYQPSLLSLSVVLTGLVEGMIWKEMYWVPLMCRAFIGYGKKLCLCIPKLENTWLLFPAFLWEQALTSFMLYNSWYFCSSLLRSAGEWKGSFRKARIVLCLLVGLWPSSFLLFGAVTGSLLSWNNFAFSWSVTGSLFCHRIVFFKDDVVFLNVSTCSLSNTSLYAPLGLGASFQGVSKADYRTSCNSSAVGFFNLVS